MKYIRVLWAAPCSLVGLVLGCIALVLGGKAALCDGAVEITFRERLLDCNPLARALRFRGIVFGHVILAVTAEELVHIRAHERVHVAQYERWGVFFFLAYPLSSLWQLLRGRHAYWDNHFEVEARVRSAG